MLVWCNTRGAMVGERVMRRSRVRVWYRVGVLEMRINGGCRGDGGG